jgi:uncharacterized Tic20 family protein
VAAPEWPRTGYEPKDVSEIKALVQQPARWHARTGHLVMGHVDQRIAALSHLSIAFGVIVGVGFLVGIAINLVIWLRSKRSPVVELHAEQAGAYQLTALLVNIALVGSWIGLAVAVIGTPDVRVFTIPVWQPMAGLLCLLTPITAIWYFGTIIYGDYGGLLVAAGRDFSYPIFGPWARRRLTAKGS